MQGCLDTTIGELLLMVLFVTALVCLWQGLSGRFGREYRWSAVAVIFLVAWASVFEAKALGAIPGFELSIILVGVYSVVVLYKIYEESKGVRRNDADAE